VFRVVICIKILKVKSDMDVQKASEDGQTKMVGLLLSDSRVDPSAENNHAIRKASERGHVEVVRLLLSDPRVDPSADIMNYYFVAIGIW
jgi:Ankyrin repeats (many copies)